MGAWAQYLKDVTTTVTKQMDAQKETVQKLEEAEQQWADALKAATADLSRLSELRPAEEAAAVPTDDASMDTSAAWEAQSKKRKASELEQQKQLLASLTAASETADSMAQAARREGSRTPRRQRTKEDTLDVSSSPELAKDKDPWGPPEVKPRMFPKQQKKKATRALPRVLLRPVDEPSGRGGHRPELCILCNGCW